MKKSLACDDKKEEQSGIVHLEDDPVPVDPGVAGEEVLDLEPTGDDLKGERNGPILLYEPCPTMSLWIWLSSHLTRLLRDIEVDSFWPRLS